MGLSSCMRSVVDRNVVMRPMTVLVVYGEDRGGTVGKVLCYKSEGLWFDSSWCHWNFSLT